MIFLFCVFMAIIIAVVPFLDIRALSATVRQFFCMLQTFCPPDVYERLESFEREREVHRYRYKSRATDT